MVMGWLLMPLKGVLQVMQLVMGLVVMRMLCCERYNWPWSCQ